MFLAGSLESFTNEEFGDVGFIFKYLTQVVWPVGYQSCLGRSRDERERPGCLKQQGTTCLSLTGAFFRHLKFNCALINKTYFSL